MTRLVTGAFLAFALVFALAPPARSALGGGGPSDAPCRDDTLAHIETFPASNPYRAILLRYQSLPPAEREYFTAWSIYETPEGEPPRTLDVRQQQIARELSTLLVAAAGQSDTTAADWPPLVDPASPHDPAGITIPAASAVRGVAQLLAKSAASLPPSEAASVYAAIAQLGRRQRSGLTLGEQLAGAGIEALAQTEIARRLLEFSPDDLVRLTLDWSRLQAPPPNAEILEREIDLVLRPTIEMHLLPALRALIAHAELVGDAPEPSADPDVGFTRHLRLSALLHVAEDEHHIVLEDLRLRETFSLRPGQVVHGVELVSLDYEKQLAVIRRGKREALVHLESKRFTERDPASVGATGGALSRLDQKLVDRIRAHPAGVDSFVREIIANNEAFLRRQADLSELPLCPPPEPGKDGADGLYLIANPGFGSALRALNRHATQAGMLQAALRARLDQLRPGEAHAPPGDPWSKSGSEPFHRESTPDGGFILASRYESAPGRPVAYKFAAPDAGLFRVSTKP